MSQLLIIVYNQVAQKFRARKKLRNFDVCKIVFVYRTFSS
jgi:hypothetical protein